MEKYIGIVNKKLEGMSGVNYTLLTYFSDDKALLKEWFKKYPGSDTLILVNNTELQSFFETFRYYGPITEKQEKEFCEKYGQLLKSLRDPED